MIYSTDLKVPCFFNKIDIMSCHHKVLIEPTSVWNIKFNSKEGLFKWLVMPFNFNNVPTMFMRIMYDIVWPFTNYFVFVYLENILILNIIEYENMKHIKQVLNTLLKHKPYVEL
jgi:hypothetical protein